MTHDYFFKPRKTSRWKEGGLLVVGINHWCAHFDDCEHYDDCIRQHHCRKYDATCPFGYSEVTGERYFLSRSTYEAFDCYYDTVRKLEENEDLVNKVGLSGYGCLKEFMLYMEGKYDDANTREQQDFWDRVAFYNYIQHFTSKPLTSTSAGLKNELDESSAEDLEAFCNVLKELRPQFVVVFHRNISEILEQKQKNIQQHRIFLKRISRLAVPTRSYTLFYCNTNFVNREKTSAQIMQKMSHSPYSALKALYEQIKDKPEEVEPNEAFVGLCDYISIKSCRECADCFRKFIDYCCSEHYIEKDKDGFYVVRKSGLMDYTQFCLAIIILCEEFEIDLPTKKRGAADDVWDYIIKSFRKKTDKYTRQFIMQSIKQNNGKDEKAKEIIEKFHLFY